jgi:phosphatidylglycerophosphate synthase
VVDPIAGWLVGLVRDRSLVTPGRLTLLAALVALLSAGCFGWGPTWAAALLFQLSFLLDCMDGKLAHARGTADPLGRVYDVAADAIRLTGCAAGLAVALTQSGHLRVDGVSYAGALVCLYLGIRVSAPAIAAARPPFAVSERGADPGLVLIEATPWQILRRARSRSVVPGTTVDTEAVAFTFGPLLGLPVVALLVAMALDLLYAVVFYARAVGRTRRTVSAAEEDRVSAP